MLLLIIFAFLAGLVTILSPCILPILPIVLSGSLGGGRKRPLGIVTGFIISFTFFTLALSTIVRVTGLPSDTLRIMAVIIIFLFGVSLLIPKIQVWLEQVFSFLSNLLPQSQNQTGFTGGIVVGLSLGVIWAPCVGPILASVITLAATSSVTFGAVIITLAYSLGTAIPMLAIIYGGRELLHKVPFLLSKGAVIQKVFGVIMILTAIGLQFNVDRKFQAYILQVFPEYGAGLTKLEDNQRVKQELDRLNSAPTARKITLEAEGTLAPDFIGSTGWVNSEPLSLQGNLKGKVVLVDFWTYSCINCIRTFPYLKKWYQDYQDKDFVIVGVHSPEFEFEKKTENVRQAMKDFGIEYPVVQDNNFGIWKAYQNRYWPAHYLIDKNGFIRYTHFGEGAYVETENAIRTLLNEEPLTDTTELRLPQRRISPETYLGWSRAAQYSQGNDLKTEEVAEYQLPSNVRLNEVGVGGQWLLKGEYLEARSSQSAIKMEFQARQVFLVLAPTEVGADAKVKVLLDGKPLPAEYQTADTNEDGVINVTEPRKYDILDLGNNYGQHTLELRFSPGIQAFAFTFG